MKRGWIGVFLLLTLLAAGSLSARAMVCWHSPIEKQLKQAARYALDSDWKQAQRIAEEAENRWKEHWHPSAVFADHGPMEEIDALFAQLGIYKQEREAIGFAAICAELSRELGAMGEAHVPNWWNLL